MKNRSTGDFVDTEIEDTSVMGHNVQEYLDSHMTSFFPQPYDVILNFRVLIAYALPTIKDDVQIAFTVLFSFENKAGDLYLAYLLETGRNNQYHADAYLIGQVSRTVDRNMRVGNISVKDAFIKARAVQKVYANTTKPPEPFSISDPNNYKRLPDFYIIKYLPNDRTGKGYPCYIEVSDPKTEGTKQAHRIKVYNQIDEKMIQQDDYGIQDYDLNQTKRLFNEEGGM